MLRRVVLMSPYPVDGYPPVRYQAEILASAGYTVHLFTSPMQHESRVVFDCPGVVLHPFALSQKSLAGRLGSRGRMLASLFALRVRHRRSIIAEIGFDPIGILMLTSVPCRHKLTIGHLHEVLLHPTKDRRVRRMESVLPQMSLVVVADAERARIIQGQIPKLPSVLTVRNLPMRDSGTFVHPARTSHFSVTYFGSLGKSQCLDSIIRSMPNWPEGAKLHLYSRLNTTIEAEWRSLAKQVGVCERVVFEGWVHADKLLPAISRHHVGLSMMRPLSDSERFACGASNKRYLFISAGVAQISDNLPGVPELIEGNAVGKSVDPDDPAQIAHAVSFYHSHPHELDRIRSEGPRLIESSLNYESDFRPILQFLADRDGIAAGSADAVAN